MAKISVNFKDLKDALTSYDLLNYKDDPSQFNVEIAIANSDNPGEGAMVDVLALTIDKKESDYSNTESDVRKIVEVFSAESGLDTRITTQKTTVIRKKKKNDDEVPF